MGQTFDPRNKDQLLSEERHELLRPKEPLLSLGLKPGDTRVLDFRPAIR